jgi:hypothetical protein
MISANEVRRGNLFKYDDRIFRIHTIAYEFPTLDTDEFGIGVVGWNNIDPVELTDEWLIKFQLPKREVKTKTSTYYIFSIRNDFEIYCHMDKSGNCLFWGVNSMADHFFIIKCDAVHVFQNTYAALNHHEELKIKQ